MNPLQSPELAKNVDSVNRHLQGRVDRRRFLAEIEHEHEPETVGEVEEGRVEVISVGVLKKSNDMARDKCQDEVIILGTTQTS